MTDLEVKIKRLVDMKVVEEGSEIAKSPREAVKVAFKLGVIKFWSDNGRFYTVELPSKKVEKIKPRDVPEYIIDKILQTKDPIHETSPKETTQEEEIQQDTAQEAKSVAHAYVPTDYNSLTSEKLVLILKDRGLPFGGSKTDKIKRLKEQDSKRE